MIKVCSIIIVCFLSSFIIGCKDDQIYVKNIYRYYKPDYNQVSVEPATDTLHFALSENNYNDIESLNVFSQSGIEYFSFYDERAASINIYEFESGKKINEISIKQLFKGQRLLRTSVYLKNLDSVFVANNTKLYLFDAKGKMKKSISYLGDPRFVKPALDKTSPIMLTGPVLFTGVRQSFDESSKREIKNWKVLYEFDLKKDSAHLHYNLPEIYRNNYYEYHHLYSGYCVNNNNRFVFSFAADSSIYETNLNDYNFAYTGKSKYQVNGFRPLTKSTVKEDGSYKSFLISGSYGPIYYDSFNQRYLRVFKHAISEGDYESKSRSPKRSLLIFDNEFKIIGENIINESIDLNEVLFAKDGGIYARVNRKDEYALHFVRLTYKESPMGQMPVTLNKSVITK